MHAMLRTAPSIYGLEHIGSIKVLPTDVNNWETAKVLKDKCRYINGEQDLGMTGLRQAKLSSESELIYPANFYAILSLGVF
ncbi:MAG: hypothetical protein DRQ35_06040 [Gammaproteobacteria bacterium]|nr:MAG: hypothetical protein DRQ35_06040 [Gammaproteobacteria bacterium]